ncbi:MAG: carboxypeptidase regulatory-like domain-containing protein [Vicinamibacterales bacterium]
MTALLALALALQQTPAPAQQPPAAPATTAPAPARRPTVAATSSLVIRVTDRKGLSAQGVKVVAEGAVGREGVSDAAGQVLFLTLPNGTYRVQASSESFITLEKEVTVRAGTTTPPVEFTLTAAPPPPAPPPPPPPPPVVAPAPAVTSAPAGEAKVLSIFELFEKSPDVKEPFKYFPVACSGLDNTQLLVVRDSIKTSPDAAIDRMLYLVGGEATLVSAGREQKLAPGWYALVPRGSALTLTRRGKNPAVVLSVAGGQPCSETR